MARGIRGWFQRDMGGDESVMGRTGRVTGAIGPGLVGEVMLPVRGSYEAFTAYAYEPTEKFSVNSVVFVMETSDPRVVYVAAAR